MNNSAGGPPAAGVRFARLAEQIADDLRERLLVGDLAEATELPVEETLRTHYSVSKPTFREAIRVLEAEGMITVRRGAIGGAIVHRPDAEHVAYTLGLALSGRGVKISDIAAALRAVEPSCAEACALREDRDREVLPILRRLHERSLKVVDNLVEVTALSRMFHEAIVDLCGNDSLSVLAGALESLWSSHESSWAQRDQHLVDIPRAERLQALDEHRLLIEHIAAGDAEKARQVALQHLIHSQQYPTEGGTQDVSISPTAVRHRFIASSG